MKMNKWSQENYSNINLEAYQHLANNLWFEEKMKNHKHVCVPELGFCWDRNMNKTKITDLEFMEKQVNGKFSTSDMIAIFNMIGISEEVKK
jgi:uncharacterized membrane protein